MLMSRPEYRRGGPLPKGDIQMAPSVRLEKTLAVVRSVPKGAVVGLGAVAIYFTINFFALAYTMRSGSPVELNGELLLMDHGRLVRRLDRAEFSHLQTLEVRGMVGHSVVFSLVAALGYVVRARQSARLQTRRGGQGR